VKITVRLGEPFWRTLGERQTVIALLPEATVSEALEILSRRCPALAAEWDQAEAKPALFLNDEMAQPDSQLSDGSTLHILWPVSGG
jgi:molybdopterin converting factor small subunit